MRISYLSTFFPFRGGIAQFNASLYREFEKQNEIKAYTFTCQYPKLIFPGQTQMVQPNDKVDNIPAERVLSTINPLSYLTTLNKIRKFNPQLNIMKFWMPYFAPSLGTVARGLQKNGTKSIAILDNVIPHETRPGDIAMIRYFLKSCDGYLTMSSTVENDLLNLEPNAKFLRLEHPLYTHFPPKVSRDEALQHLKLPKDKKYLLFFGFIRKYKGLDILIEALCTLPDDVHLIIAGEVYGKFDEYAELINRYGLQERVHSYVRYIADGEVPDFFAAAEVCVLPYRSATQSGIIGIAFNFDLPVIATDTGSLREMLETHSTGIIVKEAKPEQISEAVSNYISKDLRVSLKKNIERYKSISSWKHFAEEALKFGKSL
ncbi:MAG: glycosyltransferase [Candidatus Kapabacteria bacterium]|nr:glycosyltransferase [Candidatus Kapabacteria bacterium]